MRQVSLFVQMAAIVVVACIALVMVNRRLAEQQRQQRQHPAIPAEFERAYGGSEVKIVQFYSREGTLFEGSTTVLCYGLANARSVRIEPPVEGGVSVSINNCVEVAPERDTRYTLTAEGNDGRTVSESFVLQVRPDPATLPKITAFRIAKQEIDNGRHIFSLTFSQRNGELVDIDPPAFPTLHGSPNGSFYVSPEKTTTYTLTVTGKKGRQDRRQLTVEVPSN